MSDPRFPWQLSVLRFEWKVEDFWIGAFWRHSVPVDQPGEAKWEKFDLWVCLLPCVPLHLQLQRGWVIYGDGDIDD